VAGGEVVDEDGHVLPPDGGDGGEVDNLDGDGSPRVVDCADTDPSRAPASTTASPTALTRTATASTM
jgi:hypothetical protein